MVVYLQRLLPAPFGIVSDRQGFSGLGHEFPDSTKTEECLARGVSPSLVCPRCLQIPPARLLSALLSDLHCLGPWPQQAS
jgi:hypothetical protein